MTSNALEAQSSATITWWIALVDAVHGMLVNLGHEVPLPTPWDPANSCNLTIP